MFTETKNLIIENECNEVHRLRMELLLLEIKHMEITLHNQRLVKKIGECTAELNQRKQQIQEFTFINSHEIRVPICRLLGLKNVLDYSCSPAEIVQLAKHMSTSIQELDTLTRKANRALTE